MIEVELFHNNDKFPTKKADFLIKNVSFFCDVMISYAKCTAFYICF